MSWSEEDETWRGDASPPRRVRLMHHDARWRQEFEQTRSGLLHSCQGRVTTVEHVGSTAIPGLIAQPIIDVVAVISRPDDLSGAVDSIEGLNFRRVDTADWAASAVTLEKPRHGEPTHRVFLLHPDDDFLQRAIRLRDYLRQNPETAIQFEETKVARWKQAEGDPERYEADKSIYFAHLEDQLSGLE